VTLEVKVPSYPAMGSANALWAAKDAKQVSTKDRKSVFIMNFFQDVEQKRWEQHLD
jgi:hypothetical protein